MAARRPEILLVDDNAGDVELVRLALSEVGLGEGLHVCENAVQAFCFLAKREPFASAPEVDLMLLDLNLPVISGHRVLDVISSSKQWRHIPVVVLSSSRLPSDRVICNSLGARRFVAKPALWSEYCALARSLKSELATGTCFQPSARVATAY